MYYIFGTFDLRLHWKRRKKLLKLLQAEENIELFKIGVYEFGPAIFEIRENPRGFTMNDVLRQMGIERANMVLTVYPQPFKVERLILEGINESIIHEEFPNILSIVPLKNNELLIIMQDVKTKEVFKGLVRLIDNEKVPSSMKLAKMLSEMQERYEEVVLNENEFDRSQRNS